MRWDGGGVRVGWGSCKATGEGAATDDPTADCMNLLGMVFGMFGLVECMQNRSGYAPGESEDKMCRPSMV